MVKNLPANAGGVGSVPGPGRSLGEEKGYPMDRGACWAPGVAKESDPTERLQQQHEI